MTCHDFRDVNRIHGVTRDPLTHEYAIVTQFQNGGNLRRMISENHTNLTWENIIHRLNGIVVGLQNIHAHEYHHKDFHSGNILGSSINMVISDFGMSRPADDKDEKTLYGVIPFVAPEVLRGKEFTNSADIYGFGMIMWEILSGEPPFIDREYDQILMRDICLNEIRPLIPQYTPEPYTTLMKQCWVPISTNRPTANELSGKFWDWCTIFSDPNYQDGDTEIKRAFSKEREDQWKAQLAERARNPRELKQTHNLLISKRLDGM